MAKKKSKFKHAPHASNSGVEPFSAHARAAGFKGHTNKPIGELRGELAAAAGFSSESEVASLFPANLHKHVHLVHRGITEIVGARYSGELKSTDIPSRYADLINCLSATARDPMLDPAKTGASDPSTHRVQKRADLAIDALRQVIVESLLTPLSMLPSLLADKGLNDQDKLKRLDVYTRSLEMLYEPLQLEPIGDPGEKSIFDPRFHESAQEIAVGNDCVIKRIGFMQGDSVIRKAVVEGKE